jgi:hypothetical protein
MRKNGGRSNRYSKLDLSGILMVFSLMILSCTNKEEKLYGKIDTKVKIEKEMIQKVQNTYFPYNYDLSFKEVVAANIYSSNIVWKAPLTDHSGSWIVSVEYDIVPIDAALSLSALTKEMIRDINYTQPRARLSTAPKLTLWEEGDILSPHGYANIITRFIKAEVQYPHYNDDNETKKDFHDLLEAYKAFIEKEGYNENSILISRGQIPDSLPDPFFKVTGAKFIAFFGVQETSNNVEFIRYDLLLDFICPYLDNKEYKGVGISMHDDVITFEKEGLNMDMGIRFIYENLTIWSFYYFANHPISAYDLLYFIK